MPPIQTLLPPGGFSNLVGYHVAALDAGLAALAADVRRLPASLFEARARGAVPTPGALLGALGGRESRWIHQALGGVPTPPAPAEHEGAEAWIGWLEAVRTISLMVLRPLADRDLERLVRLPDAEDPTSLRRVLTDLLERQGYERGRLAVVAALSTAPAAR
jgi:hypothetical protein